MSNTPDRPAPSRRSVLGVAGGTLAAGFALGGLRPFTAAAATPRHHAGHAGHGAHLVAEAAATVLRYPAPAAENVIIQQGLPIGNGRIGALLTGDPANDVLYLTDATLWTGGLNDSLQGDGQFPYDADNFGSFTLLAKATLQLPGHDLSKVTGYRRTLDLSNGLSTVTYTLGGVDYRREVYASHPDDVVVVRLTQSGGGTYTGSLTLGGWHGETTTGDAAGKAASFTGKFANGLAYAATASATSATGTVAVDGARVTFTGCDEVLVLLTGGTNYSRDASTGHKDPAADPGAIAASRLRAAAKAGGPALLRTHLADYQPLFNRMTVDLGTSTDAQRSLDTAARLSALGATGAPADPELEAAYLQFGRYLMISGSRDSVPLNLQGLWIDRTDPDWMGDYHTDINVQMNYWLADRAGLSDCFDAFLDYCVTQVPSWTVTTQKTFNDPRNGFRNSSGKIAGWTTAISTNVYGGMGWWWHPAGNAWLCNSLWQHYEYTQDREELKKIYPLLKGACEFWEARLITTTVTDPDTGASRQVLIDDSDWSPEQGPTDAKGITYAQELVRDLFASYRTAAGLLSKDAAYAKTIATLQSQLYMPQVSPETGWLEEWMTPANLGETAHRHLSPLIGLFPGDRITPQDSPAALVTGVRNLLTARGMESFGWGCAWRAASWARLKDADKAYQLVRTVMKPSTGGSNGTSPNLFDMYDLGSRATLQIDANFGAPTAMIEMLVYSRPGVVELLPALPDAWAAAGRITGVGARGGITVDLQWSAGKVTQAVLRSSVSTTTEVRAGSWHRTVQLKAGREVTLRP
ncbi:glycoside hydrolase family 95 protein [Streptomyces sp. NBC_01267]|uniref:glycosyl hydrolase family 95 catalytic domain-containing protein n=1 Tax=unclassified Streptomyces TaxID=2593676 RepID=UPI002DDAC7DD|nr:MULTISPECIES: glycoside hydrolase N-terminal domain-containing protein [unclassified Streptomyces]WSC23398.1 glycoside hydrolase family 95 protein [Streptomyces sp. NBC_01766]